MNTRGGRGVGERGGGVKLVFLNFSRIIDDVTIFLENLGKYDKTYDVREYFQLYFRFFNDFLISCLKGSFSAPKLQKFSNYFISMQTFYKHKIIFHVVTSLFWRKQSCNYKSRDKLKIHIESTFIIYQWQLIHELLTLSAQKISENGQDIAIISHHPKTPMFYLFLKFECFPQNG